MVDLVLEDTCPPAASLDAHRPVVESNPLDRDRFGAGYLPGPPGNAQAPLITEDPTARLDDLGVDQRNGELRTAFVVEVLRHMDPDQPAQDSDLWRRQPHSWRGQHRLVHILGETA